jgi:hypothetical protein
MNAPIIFFHTGYDPYIAFALWQARRTNPKAPIYMLGDETNDLSFLGITHVQVKDFPGRRDALVARYEHLSLHELACERLCIERWFHLEHFVRQQGIGEFTYLDSDVLLLTQLSPLLGALPACDAAGVPSFFGLCHFRKPGIIEAFTSYILAAYQNPDQLARWRAWFAELKAQGANRICVGVSDMVLARQFVEETGVSCLDLRMPRAGLVFDGDCCGFEGEGPSRTGKRIVRDQQNRTFEITADGQKHQVAALHLYGRNKRHAASFTGWSPELVRAFLRPNYRRNFKKLIQHWWFGRRYRRVLEPGAAG